MNSIKQLRALLAFQTRTNPTVWALPLIMISPLIFTAGFHGSSHLSLFSIVMVQNLAFIGIFGIRIIAPEALQSGTTATVWNSGTEFLLTRAVDRRVLYRSRALLLYVLVMSLPLMAALHALAKPDLTISESSAYVSSQCLGHIPGSFLEANPEGHHSSLIFIPHGNILIEQWRIWCFLITAAGVQALILILYPFKYRTPLLYVIFFGAFLVPVFWNLKSAFKEAGSSSETIFLIFAAHQLLIWILTVVLAISVHVWCERRFMRMEQ